MYLFQLGPVRYFAHLDNHLHSTMYLFQPGSDSFAVSTTFIYIPLCIYFNCKKSIRKRGAGKFTFHYVSISTCRGSSQRQAEIQFTFHYVSISTFMQFACKCFSYLDLHSTMYLFQLQTLLWSPCLRYSFTFHYVSISTTFTFWLWLCCVYLHSTMYLFQQNRKNARESWQPHLHSTMYLFQQRWHQLLPARQSYLHSTMYLFQRVIISHYRILY